MVGGETGGVQAHSTVSSIEHFDCTEESNIGMGDTAAKID